MRSLPARPRLACPIQRLPPELLSMIFWHAIPRRSEFVEPSVHAAPILLCRVCKQWRDLAERTPELWSSISLFLLRPYAIASQAYEKWISRSGSCPMLIKVVVLVCPSDPRWTKHLRPLTDFMHNISRQSHRWLIADISVPGHYMEKLLANEAPILQKLILRDPLVDSGGDAATRPWEHVFRLSAAPALRQFILKQPLRIIPNNSHPITSIHFDAFSLHQVTVLFNGCPQLEDLNISFKSEVRFCAPGLWTFPRLRTLVISLHYHNSKEMAKFLDHLCLPAVRSLTINGLRSARHLHLVRLLDHTDGGLQDLTLLNISTCDSEVFEYLKRVPLLKSLHLVDSHGFDIRCVQRLTWIPGGDTNVCPRLQNLWLLRSECQLLVPGMVGDMIASRGPRRAHGLADRNCEPEPLREIRFDGSQYQHDRLLERKDIVNCTKNGLVWKR
ncbi:hypothetical protein M0805_005250 [Coniferiporia weirii]|nr:hypothetical protein M0805_005250 [Coniferiporia weirii]